MKIQLKHLGYALLVTVAFINFWFFRFNLHEVFFGDRDCAYNNPCHPDSWDSIRPVGSLEQAGDHADLGMMVAANSTLNRMKYDIYWMELFATAMLDTIAVTMALAFIISSPSKEKSS